jgi:hypothetical protein
MEKFLAAAWNHRLQEFHVPGSPPGKNKTKNPGVPALCFMKNFQLTPTG